MIQKTGMFKNVSSFQYKVIEFSRLFNDFCKKMMQTEKVAMSKGCVRNSVIRRWFAACKRKIFRYLKNRSALPFGIIAKERTPASDKEAGVRLLSSDRGYRTRSERPMRSVVVREMPLSWQSRETVVP